MSTAITRAFLEDLFASIAESGLGEKFLNSLSEKVIWTATGTSPLSGRFNSKKEYREDVLGKLRGKLEYSPKPQVDRILADGNWGAVHFHTSGARALNGYDFSMEYCWLLKVENEEIVEVVGFFDQKKVSDLMNGEDHRRV